MARLVMFCDYLKKTDKAHILDNLNYISTREGVDIYDHKDERYKTPLNKSVADRPVSDAQKLMIKSLIKDTNTSSELFTYEDYTNNPNMYTASVFISDALYTLEELSISNKRYVKYISERPGAVKDPGEAHGLWDQTGKADLNKYREILERHEGNVWRSIISLRREDSESLSFDKKDWQELIVGKINTLAIEMGIPLDHLNWVAAYHDESYHPHIHMMVWSTNQKEGFLDVDGIKKFKSALANDIFQNEMWLHKEYKTEIRSSFEQKMDEELDRILRMTSKNINTSDFDLRNEIRQLSSMLSSKGSCKYGFQNQEIKDATDHIVAKIITNPSINPLLSEYLKANVGLASFYMSTDSTRMDKYIQELSTKLIHPGKDDRKVLHNFVLSAAKNIKQNWEQQTILEKPVISEILTYANDHKQPVIEDIGKLAIPIARLSMGNHDSIEHTIELVKEYVPDSEKALECVLKARDRPFITKNDINILCKAYNVNFKHFANDEEYLDHQVFKMVQSIVSYFGIETSKIQYELKTAQAMKDEDRLIIRAAQNTTSSKKY